VRRALSETSSRACLDATDAIPDATTDGLVSDGSYPSIVCIASACAGWPSTEPPFACSRKKSHGLDVASIYTVKTSFEHCPRRRRARPSRSQRAFRQGHHVIADG
jgi:hypothetical protein